MASGSGAAAARPMMTRSCRSLSKVRESGAGSGSREKGTMRSRLASTAISCSAVTALPRSVWRRPISAASRLRVNPDRSFRQDVRHLIQNSARRLQSESARAFRQHQHGDGDRDKAAEADLQHAREGRPDRTCAEVCSDQEHEHGGKRRGAKARIDRRRERHRGDRKRENESLRKRRRMRNEHAERRGVDRPAESPDHVFDGRAKRSADAYIRDDDRGQHCPQSVQRKVEAVDDGESQETGDRRAQTEAQLGSVSAELTANQAPDG